MQNSNANFLRMVQQLRRIMPALAGVLLIGVYAVSAIAGGMFLAHLMKDLAGGVWLAFAIGTAIQATRATLVFFPQLNPTRPIFGHTGEIIAVLMGLVSIAEILSLTKVSGMPYPVGVSLSILMLAGIGVELFLLREIRHLTEMQLFGDRAHWQEVKDYYRARAEFQREIETIKNEAAGITTTTAHQVPPHQVPPPSAQPGHQVPNQAGGTPVQVPFSLEFSSNGNGKHH